MDIDLAALPNDVETLQRMVRTLAVECSSLCAAQAEIERLRLIIRKLQRSQFGRRAERLGDDQLQLGLEDLGADLARVEATLPSAAAKVPSTRLLTDQPSMPAHLSREDRRLDLDQQACPFASQTRPGTHVQRPSDAPARRAAAMELDLPTRSRSLSHASGMDAYGIYGNFINVYFSHMWKGPPGKVFS